MLQISLFFRFLRNFFISSVSLFLFLFVGSANADSVADAALFSYNKNAVEESFRALDEIENCITLNISELNNQPPEILLTAFSSHLLIDPDNSAFLIGCCLGPVGLALIWTAGGDGEAFIRGTFGCIIPSGIFALGLYTSDPMLIHLAVDLAITFLEL